MSVTRGLRRQPQLPIRNESIASPAIPGMVRAQAVVAAEFPK